MLLVVYAYRVHEERVAPEPLPPPKQWGHVLREDVTFVRLAEAQSHLWLVAPAFSSHACRSSFKKKRTHLCNMMPSLLSRTQRQQPHTFETGAPWARNGFPYYNGVSIGLPLNVKSSIRISGRSCDCPPTAVRHTRQQQWLHLPLLLVRVFLLYCRI